MPSKMPLRFGIPFASALLLAITVTAVACAPASPAGQSEGEQPTPTPEKAAAEPTATPEPEPTPTPQPPPDPAKLAPGANTLLTLRDAIAAREEAANSQGDGARNAPSEDQPPINFGVPIPTTVTAYINASTEDVDTVDTFIADNGGAVLRHMQGPETGHTPAPRVATVIVAEIPTSLLEDLAGQDATGYIFLADGLYPRIGSGLKEMIMERAEQLLTHEGRPAPTPEPIGQGLSVFRRSLRLGV